MAEKRLIRWLKSNVPEIADVVGDLLPDVGILRVVRGLIKRKSPEKLEEFDTIAAEVTARWGIDSGSTTLAKNVRPLVVLLMTVAVLILVALDSGGLIEVKERWVSLLELVWLATVGGYFGLRTAEKLRR